MAITIPQPRREGARMPRMAATPSITFSGTLARIGIGIALVLVAVFVPTAFMGGIAGQFYKQFALTIASATVISLVVSLTLSPALAAVILTPHDASTSRGNTARADAIFLEELERDPAKYLPEVDEAALPASILEATEVVAGPATGAQLAADRSRHGHATWQRQRAAISVEQSAVCVMLCAA